MTIIRLEEVDSTNLYAKKNLSGFDDKTVIVADCQTLGHGRFNRKWVDLGKDNIYMSVILKPDEQYSNNFPNITQLLSVIICQTLEDYNVKAQIKWPNDVLVNNKKIAGILCESVVQGNKFKGIILGAGINLNSNQKDLSLISDKEATALNLELSCDKISKEEFLQDLLKKFFIIYDSFLKNGFSLIYDEYVKRTCFLGKEISVRVFEENKSGIAKLINKSGELVLDENKKDVILTMGDIL